MRLFVWLFRAFIFFTLFAFALNNQQNATVRWFFGVEWNAPMVIVVLAAFAGGCAIGVLAMLPSLVEAPPRRPARGADAGASRTRRRRSAPPPSDFGPEHPPREGL